MGLMYGLAVGSLPSLLRRLKGVAAVVAGTLVAVITTGGVGLNGNAFVMMRLLYVVAAGAISQSIIGIYHHSQCKISNGMEGDKFTISVIKVMEISLCVKLYRLR